MEMAWEEESDRIIFPLQAPEPAELVNLWLLRLWPSEAAFPSALRGKEQLQPPLAQGAWKREEALAHLPTLSQ